MLEVKDLNVGWQNKKVYSPVFSNLNFQLPEHKLTALCGINGSGKSTLLSVMSGITPDTLKTTGEILLNGNKLINLSAREKAKQISFLVQKENSIWDISARKFVENGRYAHQKWYSENTPEDIEIVNKAIATLGLEQLQDRSIFNISGGEFQRFRIARALAQQTPYIFMDEPLAGLDLNSQKELILILKQLCESGKTVFISIHDINLASTYADHMILLKKDRTGFYQGTPTELLQEPVISEVFGSGFQTYTHPITKAVQLF